MYLFLTQCLRKRGGIFCLQKFVNGKKYNKMQPTTVNYVEKIKISNIDTMTLKI